jgi:ATPases of the AAA+ class
MSDKSVNSLFGVLKFTMTILLPRYTASLPQLLSSVYPAKQRIGKTKLKLELWSVPEDAFMCLVPMNIKPSIVGNMDSSILVSLSTIQALGVSSCSWLKLKKNSEKYIVSNSSQSYLVQVIAVPDIKDSVAVVTSVLHYNIIQALLLVNDIVQAEKLGELEHFVPNIATLARVSLLQPSYDINTVMDTVLSCYFEHPHYLRIGDVFCVDVIKYASSVTYLNNKLTTLYFKVLDIEGPCYGDTVRQGWTRGYYIIKAFTTLLQCTNQQGYVPRRDVVFIKGEGSVTGINLKSHLLNTCPSGLDAYRDELLTCVQPYILNVNRFNLKPLFLVCGPRGVGKTVMIRNVAERLGLNVYDVDSFEVQGGSPSYAEGKFKHIFTKVREFAPCVILLRNLEVYFLLSQQSILFYYLDVRIPFQMLKNKIS